MPSLASEYLSKSSLPAVSHIFKETSHVRRGVWILFFLLMCLWFAYIAYVSARRYLQGDTMIHTGFHRNAGHAFPDFTFCPIIDKTYPQLLQDVVNPRIRKDNFKQKPLKVFLRQYMMNTAILRKVYTFDLGSEKANWTWKVATHSISPLTRGFFNYTLHVQSTSPLRKITMLEQVSVNSHTFVCNTLRVETHDHVTIYSKLKISIEDSAIFDLNPNGALNRRFSGFLHPHGSCPLKSSGLITVFQNEHKQHIRFANHKILRPISGWRKAPRLHEQNHKPNTMQVLGESYVMTQKGCEAFYQTLIDQALCECFSEWWPIRNLLFPCEVNCAAASERVWRELENIQCANLSEEYRLTYVKDEPIPTKDFLGSSTDFDIQYNAPTLVSMDDSPLQPTLPDVDNSSLSRPFSKQVTEVRGDSSSKPHLAPAFKKVKYQSSVTLNMAEELRVDEETLIYSWTSLLGDLGGSSSLLLGFSATFFCETLEILLSFCHLWCRQLPLLKAPKTVVNERN